MRELRVSIPFIGGVTAIYTKDEVSTIKSNTKENVMNIVNRFKSAVSTVTSTVTSDRVSEMLKDEAFQKALLKSFGYTVAVGVGLVGVNLVWKWYVAYVTLAKLGVVVTTATWFKALGMTTAIVAGSVITYRTIDQHLVAKAAALGSTK